MGIHRHSSVASVGMQLVPCYCLLLLWHWHRTYDAVTFYWPLNPWIWLLCMLMLQNVFTSTLSFPFLTYFLFCLAHIIFFFTLLFFLFSLPFIYINCYYGVLNFKVRSISSAYFVTYWNDSFQIMVCRIVLYRPIGDIQYGTILVLYCRVPTLSYHTELHTDIVIRWYWFKIRYRDSEPYST